MIRAKGHFWIATQPDWVAEFALAGALTSVNALGNWWASIPKERWPDDERAQNYMREHWEEPWGDRRQEIVFIGNGINWPDLKGSLDACLLPETLASNIATLPNMSDPFPQWRRPEAAE